MEYLTAGKFKVHKETQASSETGDVDITNPEEYHKYYSSKILGAPKSSYTQISFAAIATVCDCSKETVRRILTDIFACLIETSRKTQKEARIKFKDFGLMYLFKNREIAFKGNDDS